MLPQNLSSEFLYRRLCFQLQLLFDGPYREESGILRVNVPYVNVRRCKVTYPKFNGYEGNDAKKYGPVGVPHIIPV